MPGGEQRDAGILLRVAIYSLLVNAGLVASKLLLAFSTGSLALSADAIHSGIDIIGSVALILGLFISRRKSSAFPWGLYKVENIVSVLISFLLFATAYEIVYQAIFVPSEIHAFSSWVLILVAALVTVPLLFGRYEVGIGTRFNSPSLVADGKNFITDMFASVVVFFGLLGQYFQFPVDRFAAIIVAIFIVRAGWDILASGMRVLLDASIDLKTLDLIRSTILRDPAVVSVNRIQGRNSGRYVFVEAEISLRLTDLGAAHRISERIEREITDAVPNVDHTVLHYEPWHPTTIRYAVPLADHEGTISGHFGDAPYFALVDINIPGKMMERTEIVANPHTQLVKGKGLAVARFLLAFKPSVVAAREDLKEKGPGYVFGESGIETEQTRAETLGAFIRECTGQL